MRHDDDQSTAGTCPDENEFSRLLDGDLPEAARLAIERHVDRCGACNALLRELAPMVLTRSAHDAPPPDEEAPAPAQRYEVLRPLGSGGAGRVYEAVDHVLARHVALKFLHAREEGEEPETSRRRILAEARALARLSHPHVVQVFDVGVDGEAVFLAMELVDGLPLGAWMKAAPRPFEERLRVACEVGSALAAAHRVGLVHRDVKPANVVVGNDGHARLTDFGLACATEVGSPLRDDENGVHAPPAGTPLYMAPELIAGASASASTDQYAFGLLLYECLYGVHPYAAPTLEGVRASQRRGIRRAAPRGDVPLVLHAIVARAAAPAPGARFASIGELLLGVTYALDFGAAQRVRVAAVAQIVMSVVYLSFSGFVTFAVLTDTGASDPEPLSSALEWIGGFLALLTFSGWAPLAAIWGGLNAWALLRGKPWARASTIVYGGLSVLSCIGLPVGLYALFAMFSTPPRPPTLDRRAPSPPAA